MQRQQTLRAAIDWSYDLLSPAEQSLFCKLAVFAGGFTADAVNAITRESLDLLTRLLDKSLVEATTAGSEPARYRMLETVQQYAFMKLKDTSQADKLAELHYDYYLALAQTAEGNLQSLQQVQWLDTLEAEQDNLRAALRWTIEHNQEAAMQLTVALFWFWERRSYFSEGVNWLERILTGKYLAPVTSSSEFMLLQAKTFWASGSLITQLGDNQTAVARLETSVSLFRDLLKMTMPEDKIELKQGLALALTHLSQAVRPLGRDEQARAFGEEAVSLLREIGDNWGLAFSLSQLAYIVRVQAGYAAARPIFEESLRLYRMIGDLRGIGDVLSSLGIKAHMEGEDEQAQRWLEESLELERRVGDRYQIGICLVELVFVAMAQGDYARADSLSREALSLFRGLGHITGIANTLVARAALACHEKQYDRAARLYGAVDGLREAAGGILIQRRADGYDDLVNKARHSLGKTVYETEYTLGKLFTIDDMLKTALG